MCAVQNMLLQDTIQDKMKVHIDLSPPQTSRASFRCIIETRSRGVCARLKNDNKLWNVSSDVMLRYLDVTAIGLIFIIHKRGLSLEQSDMLLLSILEANATFQCRCFTSEQTNLGERQIRPSMKYIYSPWPPNNVKGWSDVFLVDSMPTFGFDEKTRIWLALVMITFLEI